MIGERTSRSLIIVGFKCPMCGKDQEQDFDYVEPTAKSPRTETATDITCRECHAPFVAIVKANSSDCYPGLEGYPNVVTHMEIPNYLFGPSGEDYGPPPTDPRSIFTSSHAQAMELLGIQGSDEGDNLLNRMIFVQQIGALEAFLSDSLLNAVRVDGAIMLKLLEVDKILQKKTVSLSEVARDPNIVSKTVRAHLTGLPFHNLGWAASLYRGVVNIDLFEDDGDKERLHRAVELRHHCVHRNGFDLEGAKLTVFTKDYVREIAAMMLALVERISLELEFLPVG